MEKGFGLVETIVAVALFAIVATTGISTILGGFGANRLGDEETKATIIASEGIEGARSLFNQGWTTPFLGTNCTGTCGLATASGTWGYSGTNNVLGKFTRTVKVIQSNRDGSGNIVDSGGSADTDTYKVTSSVTWNFSPTRNNTVTLNEYFTNFHRIIGKGGMLVYGDGGTTTDAIKYQTVDSAGTWTTAAATADIDGSTTNKVLQAVELEASPTRNEKVMISRHYDGTTQYIYGQVYNGTTWGNVQLMSSWAATTFLSVRNFSGTYLNDGTFMVVYSDNTNTPKYRTWNGTAWSVQGSLTSLGAAGEIPSFIKIAARPTTNEVMAVFFTQALDTISQYWSGSTWSAITSHATNGFNANNQENDFAWSSNTPTIGAIIYMTAGGDKTPRVKIFQANGSGGGTWGSQVNGANVSQAVRVMSLSERPGANEFQSCYKDQQAAPNIECRKITFTGTTPVFASPTNPIITTASVNSTNPSFSMAFQVSNNNISINVYSDNTNIPKLKKYTASTSTWDTAATSLSTSPYTLGSPVQSTEVVPLSSSNDMMVIMADNNLDLYSVEWDGTNSVMYTTPAGKAFLQHGVNGSAVANFWYDFKWDGI